MEPTVFWALGFSGKQTRQVPYPQVFSNPVHNKQVNKLIRNVRCPTFSGLRNSFLPLILQNIQRQDSPSNSRMQTHIAILVMHMMDHFEEDPSFSIKVKVQVCQNFTC